jgi:hypothetical protein
MAQFTTSQLLLAIAWFSAACAAYVAIPNLAEKPGVWLLAVFAFCASLGAGIGTICDKRILGPTLVVLFIPLIYFAIILFAINWIFP